MTKTFPISLDLNRKYNIKLQITEHCPSNHFLFSDLPRAVLRFIELEPNGQLLCSSFKRLPILSFIDHTKDGQGLIGYICFDSLIIIRERGTFHPVLL